MTFYNMRKEPNGTSDFSFLSKCTAFRGGGEVCACEGNKAPVHCPQNNKLCQREERHGCTTRLNQSSSLFSNPFDSGRSTRPVSHGIHYTPTASGRGELYCHFNMDFFSLRDFNP